MVDLATLSVTIAPLAHQTFLPGSGITKSSGESDTSRSLSYPESRVLEEDSDSLLQIPLEVLSLGRLAGLNSFAAIVFIIAQMSSTVRQQLLLVASSRRRRRNKYHQRHKKAGIRPVKKNA